MNRTVYIARQTLYTVFAFIYFLGLAAECTIKGFYMLTVCGRTPGNKLRYHKLLQRRARFVMHHIPGTTFEYHNEKGETFEKPAVIVSNHQSHIDLMAIMMLTPKLIILTKKWVWHNPFYGIVIRYADYMPANNGEDTADKIKKMVEQGYSVVIFPEGTRSADCSILRFHRGAFYIAQQLGLDIVPVYLNGFGKVLPKLSWHLHPGRLSLEVLERIERENPILQNGYRAATKQLHKLYIDKHEEMCNHR